MGGVKIAAQVRRKGNKISFCIMNPIFSLTLIVKVEIDFSGRKVLTSRHNKIIFFFKKS